MAVESVIFLAIFNFEVEKYVCGGSTSKTFCDVCNIKDLKSLVFTHCLKKRRE